MHLVAIRPRPGDEAPERIAALCEGSGLPPYEARTRVRVLRDWPGVLLSTGDLPRAIEIEAHLKKLGFEAWTMPGHVRARRLVARRFEVRGGTIHAQDDDGNQAVVTPSVARLMLEATDFGVDVDQVLEHEAGAGSVGAMAARALLGLPNRPSVARVVQRARERRERFVRLFSAGVVAVEFRASSLQYAALPMNVAPTRVENFARALQMLREALTDVRHDDRLVARSAQTRILGPALAPQRHLETAIALLGTPTSAPSDPYR